MKVLRKNGEMTEVSFEEQEGKKAFWHTSAHVLAQAVKRLYPKTKLAIGPAFPAWIAPVQVKVLPVSEKYNGYVQDVVKYLEEKEIRAEADYRNEKLGYKIREARMDKVPYIIVAGENEKKNFSVSVRQRDAENDKQDNVEMSLKQAADLIKRG